MKTGADRALATPASAEDSVFQTWPVKDYAPYDSLYRLRLEDCYDFAVIRPMH